MLEKNAGNMFATSMKILVSLTVTVGLSACSPVSNRDLAGGFSEKVADLQIVANTNYFLQNVATNQNAAVGGGTGYVGDSVITYFANTALGQQFQFIALSSTVYEIQEQSAGYCLSVTGAALTLQTCNGSSAQQFSLTSGSNGSYALTSSSGTCLSAPVQFSTINPVTCDGGTAQLWNLISNGSSGGSTTPTPTPTPVPTPTPTPVPSPTPTPTPIPSPTPTPTPQASGSGPSSGTNYFFQNLNFSQNAAVGSGSGYVGDSVITYFANSSLGQQFQVISFPNNSFEIQEQTAHLCFSVTGSTLSLQTCTGDSTQNFTFSSSGSNYVIRSSSGLCLAAPAQFSAIVANACDSSNSQLWNLISNNSGTGVSPTPTPVPSPTPVPTPVPTPTPNPTPVSNGGGLQLAVGLKKLVSTYSGPAMRVQRRSDNATADINFASSGAVDSSALLSFLGSAQTSGFVVELYDQSGNGNNVTQSTVANAPTVMINAPTAMTINGVSFLTARSVITSTATESPMDGPGFWNLPSSLSVNSQGTSALLAYSPDFSGGEGFEEFNLGNSGSLTFDLIRQAGGFYGLISSGNAWLPYGSGYYPRQQPTVAALVTSSGLPAFYLDGVAYAGVGNIAAATLSGGTLLGGINTNNTTFANFLGFEVYSSSLSSTQVATLSTSIIPRAIPGVNIVGDGDSITEGHCSTYGRAALRYAEPQLSTAVDITNIALGGTTTSNPLNNISSPTVSSSRVARLYRAGSTNLYYVAIGTNDIHVSNSTAQSAFSNLQSILSDAKSLGYRTAVATVMHEAGETTAQSQQVDLYNGLIRSAVGGLVDSLVDYAANSNLQSPSFGAGYSCDGTHPNDAGYSVMGGIAARALNSLIP